jgi:hypothetical protein
MKLTDKQKEELRDRFDDFQSYVWFSEESWNNKMNTILFWMLFQIEQLEIELPGDWINKFECLIGYLEFIANHNKMPDEVPSVIIECKEWMREQIKSKI